MKSFKKMMEDMKRISKNEPNDAKAKELIKAYLREQKKKVPEWMIID